MKKSINKLPSLQQLRFLSALAEHRHSGRAAAACDVTQSTLSAGLQELEKRLGANLVERRRRHVLLTPLGAEFVVRGRKLLLDAENLAELAQAAKEPLSGPLRPGVTLVPQMAVGTEITPGSGLVARRLAGDPSRTIALAWRRGSTRKQEFQAFGRYLTSVLDDRATVVR